jgi:hypothetical protein
MAEVIRIRDYLEEVFGFSLFGLTLSNIQWWIVGPRDESSNSSLAPEGRELGDLVVVTYGKKQADAVRPWINKPNMYYSSVSGPHIWSWFKPLKGRKDAEKKETSGSGSPLRET